MKNVIAVVGLCGSGKSTICDYFESINFKVIHYGGVVLNEVKKRGLPLEQKYEREVREELRNKYGMAAVCIVTLPIVKEYLKEGHKVLIDGLYSMAEYKLLMEEFGDELMVLAVFSPKELRFKHLSNRKLRPLTREEAIDRDMVEIETLDKGGPIALADHTIINDNSIDAFINRLKDVLRKENVIE